eukprot:CAMPEP_0184866690 /NCGR_PEP_ID=MMETSP0580-20130426/23314_1 /TAXON_ID=1118495 /ORGANISM="Dactyliosolen fragilissimus" /LENGTH=497 /DNA_ID=CAMNT_0027366505 /DNA_START=167 /DNA_END=1660 /DNA_ORIENTATION=-
MIRRMGRDVNRDYETIRILGEGSIGAISLVRKRESKVGGSAYNGSERNKLLRRGQAPSIVVDKSRKTTFAMKSIILSRVTPEYIDELRNEVEVLKSLDHPNIVRAYEVYEDKRNIYVVMEYCSGGDLHTRAPYTESEAAKIIGKTISALTYMHERNIVHRDLKFENIMFESRHPNAEINLIDFGLSKKCKEKGEIMKEGYGTIYTMAPQVLTGAYSSKADLWSIGVITYMLISGKRPFPSRNRKILMQQIFQVDYSFDSYTWNEASNESQDFIRALLVFSEEDRMDGRQALSHKWLNQEFPLSERVPDDKVMTDISEKLAQYSKEREFMKIAKMVVAHKSTNDDIKELKKAFDAIDTANEGTIELSEFVACMKKLNKFTDKEIKSLFSQIDSDNDGYINYTEFLAATLDTHGRIEEERLANAFDRLDSDDTGFISEKNLREFLGKDYSDDKFKTFLKEADHDDDGKISFDDFLKAFRDDQHAQLEDMRESISVSQVF